MNDWEIKQWLDYLMKLGYSEGDAKKIIASIIEKRGLIPSKPNTTVIKQARPDWEKGHSISIEEKQKRDKLKKAIEETKRSIVRDLTVGMGTNNPQTLEAMAAFNAQHVYTPVAALEWGFPIQTLLGIGTGHLLGNLGGEYYGERGAQLGGIIGGLAGGLIKGPTIQRVLDWPMQFTYAPNRAAHFYVNVSPGSYHIVGNLSKGMQLRRWVKDMLSGKDANTSITKWDLDELADELLASYNLLPKELIKDARRNAFKLYCGLEQDMPVFIKNADGTYSLNLDWWKSRISTDDYSSLLEALLKRESKHAADIIDRIKNGELFPSGDMVDYMTTAGGNLEQKNTYSLGFSGNKSYSVEELIDTWDAHPFRRSSGEYLFDPTRDHGDQISERILNRINKLGNKIDSKVDLARNKLLKTLPGDEILSDKEIWDSRSPLEKASIKVFTPILNRILKLGDYLRYLDVSDLESWIPGLHKLNEWGKNFEVGQVAGTTPWVQKTRVPVTREYVPVSVDAQSSLNIPYGMERKIYFGFKPEPYSLLPLDVLNYNLYGILPKNNINSTYSSEFSKLINELAETDYVANSFKNSIKK